MSIDFGEDLSRSTPLGIIAKLMTNAQQQNLPIEDDLTPDYQTVSPLEDIHDVSILIDSGLIEEDTDDHIQEFPYVMKTPESPYPYDLIHNTIGAGFSFPETGKKFAGRISNNSDTHIKIDHDSVDSRLDVGNGSFAFAFWIFKTSTGTQGIFSKRDIMVTTNAGIDIAIQGTSVNLRISDGVNVIVLSGDIPSLNDGNPHSVIINVPDTGNLEVFIDNVSMSTIDRGLVGNINNTRDVIIFGRETNGVVIQELDGDMAWFIWKKTEIFDATQRADYHSDGLLDLRTTQDVEVITIPGMVNENPLPNASIGRCSFGA